MGPLDRKILRDLWRLRGQVLAIAMVISAGVAVLIMSLGALDALRTTAGLYYERHRFAHVFTSLERAPERVAARVSRLPGVQSVEPRISKLALLDIEGFEEPVIGQLLSIPEDREPLLNRLAIRAGRSVAPGRPDEVVLSEAFAEAHALHPGGRLHAIMNGHKRSLEIVGIALSPEFVYAIGPGALMPDDRRFGVLWMGREALAAAYDLDGAFNDLSLSLLRGADVEPVLEGLDRLLEDYGGVGAYDRSDQVSHWFLSSEMDQLANLASILPAIFLTVAAFLTSMVLNRLIAVEQSEIGLLKAFGYSNAAVGWHYAKLVMALTSIGIALGWALGWWMGWSTTRMYADFFSFPFFHFEPDASLFVAAGAASLAASLLGTLRAVRRAALLPPAESMRPPAPPLYRHDGPGSRLAAVFDQPTRMIFRHLGRWPGRSLATATGVALSVALLVMSLQWRDAVEHMVHVYFEEAQRQDLTVGLVDARSEEALRGFDPLPGVLGREGARPVSARLRAGARSHREAVQGVPADARLAPVYDASGSEVPVPPEGLLLSTKLAEKLGVGRGDRVTVEVLEGRRPVRQVPVAALFETYIGMPAYMNLEALNRMLQEAPSISAVHLAVDRRQEAALFAELKQMPAVAAVTLRRAAIQEFRDTMAETMFIFLGFFGAFACMLGFGVTYNSARIAVSERGRELATLRVLGMSRFEISYILLGEVALLVVLALPLGCLYGWALAMLMADAFETDLYRVPMVLRPSTFGVAALFVLAATALSALLVRRRLDHLDLVAVLKTRE